MIMKRDIFFSLQMLLKRHYDLLTYLPEYGSLGRVCEEYCMDCVGPLTGVSNISRPDISHSRFPKISKLVVH